MLSPGRSSRPQLKGEACIDIDLVLDVNEILARMQAVFGFLSTVLYEALAFGCRAFVFDSSVADRCADREIFGERVTDPASAQMAVDTIFNPGPQDDTARGRVV